MFLLLLRLIRHLIPHNSLPPKRPLFYDFSLASQQNGASKKRREPSSQRLETLDTTKVARAGAKPDSGNGTRAQAIGASHAGAAASKKRSASKYSGKDDKGSSCSAPLKEGGRPAKPQGTGRCECLPEMPRKGKGQQPRALCQAATGLLAQARARAQEQQPSPARPSA